MDGFRVVEIPFKNSNLLVAVTSPFVVAAADVGAGKSLKFKGRTFFRIIGRAKSRFDDVGDSSLHGDAVSMIVADVLSFRSFSFLSFLAAML